MIDGAVRILRGALTYKGVGNREPSRRKVSPQGLATVEVRGKRDGFPNVQVTNTQEKQP